MTACNCVRCELHNFLGNIPQESIKAELVIRFACETIAIMLIARGKEFSEVPESVSRIFDAHVETFTQQFILAYKDAFQQIISNSSKAG